MTEISVLDLQNLRHLIGGFDTTHCKMQDYAHEAQDPQVKQSGAMGEGQAMTSCPAAAAPERMWVSIRWLRP